MPSAGTLVGREAELELIDEALAAVAAGRPRTLAVGGAPGLGKTRLLAELGARAAARGALVLSGAAAELERDLPYWVFVDALDEYVEGLDRRVLDRLDARVRAELGHVLPALADEPPAPAGGLHERYRTHRAVRDLLDALAATRPLVLALDDLHWADAASADLLMALLRRPPARGVLLALAARPLRAGAPLASALERAHREGALRRVQLQALTPEQASELLGPQAGNGLAAALHRESGGNPFYLEQLARAPRGAATSTATGAGPAAVGAAADVELAGLRVPPMVAAALTEELAGLPAPARTLLEAASVAGDPFELGIAAAAAGVAEPGALDALEALLSADLVRATDVPRRFAFRHPIVRRAVYEAASPVWRLGAHERAAAALRALGAGPAALAHHVERCAREGDAAAVALLRAAGDDAALRAPATAAHFYGGALRLLGAGAAGAERVELLLARARSLAATGRFADARAALLAGLDVAPADALALRTGIVATCARVEHLLGLHEQAHERLVRALDELPDERSPEAIGLLIELAMDGQHRMAYAAMDEWGRRLAAAAAGTEDAALGAAAAAAAARGAAFAGALERAAVERDRAAALVDALPDAELARRLDALTHLAGADMYLHRYDEAERHARRALELGRATGQGQLFPLVFAILGMTWTVQGRLADAAEPLDAAIEAARTTGNAHTIAWALYARARVAVAAGDLDLAYPAAHEALDLAWDGAPSHVSSTAALAAAEVDLAVGRAHEAAEALERTAGGPGMPLTAESFRALGLEVLVRCRLALGETDAARAAAAAAMESARRVGLPLVSVWAERAHAQVALASGVAAAAAEAALRSAATADDIGAPAEAAHGRLVAGEALAALGRGDEATEQLRAAVAGFEACGALRGRDAAEQQLRRLGHHVHRRSQATAAGGEGVESLTRRELEIARLIVDRRTNREIAEELFLSPRTVETHVRNLFGKLGAQSRVEVARLVERHDRLAATAGGGGGER